jgi:hypothetical protein
MYRAQTFCLREQLGYRELMLRWLLRRLARADFPANSLLMRLCASSVYNFRL